MLQDDDEFVRRKAIDALVNIGTAYEIVVPALIAMLQDNDASIRRWAIDVLGKIETAYEIVVPSLITMLQDDDEFVRRKAIDALGTLETTNEFAISALMVAVPEMINLLVNESKIIDEQLRIDPYLAAPSFQRDFLGVTPVLANLGSLVETVVPSLLVALENENAEIKYKVARVLELIGRPNALSAVPALNQLFLDETQSISARSAAARALREIAPQTLDNHAELEQSLLGIEKAIQSLMRGTHAMGCGASPPEVRLVAAERNRQLAMCSIPIIQSVFWWKCRN